MKSRGSDMHARQAKREVAAHVYSDYKGKPQTVRPSTKAHTEYVAVPHPDKTSGYKAKLVPKTPAAKKAAAKLAKMNAPVSPSMYING